MISARLPARSNNRVPQDAYRDYEEGWGPKASLNFGDCFAYALAKETGEALLFKGDDFSSTDIASALDGR
jgi:ribonuclease VapC